MNTPSSRKPSMASKPFKRVLFNQDYARRRGMSYAHIINRCNSPYKVLTPELVNAIQSGFLPGTSIDDAWRPMQLVRLRFDGALCEMAFASFMALMAPELGSMGQSTLPGELVAGMVPVAELGSPGSAQAPCPPPTKAAIGPVQHGIDALYHPSCYGTGSPPSAVPCAAAYMPFTTYVPVPVPMPIPIMAPPATTCVPAPAGPLPTVPCAEPTTPTKPDTTCIDESDNAFEDQSGAACDGQSLTPLPSISCCSGI